MLLNRFELLLLKSNLRRMIHHHFDFRLWEQMNSGAELSGKALEVGCGRGFGLEVLARSPYKFESLVGVEPDPRMSLLAKKTVAAWPHVQILEGSLSQTIAQTDLYDFALCSQVLHHIDDWQEAIKEVSCRVKQGGTLFLVESLRGFIQAPFIRKIMKHPEANRFDKQELLKELSICGFENIRYKSFGDAFVWVVAQKTS